MSKLPEDRREIFKEVYNFYEQNWDMPDTDEAWQKLALQLGPLAEKHGNTHLIRNLLMACYETISDEIKDAREAINNAGTV